MNDYSMFRYYKGEKENPFDKESQNSAHMFWLYESVFERDFIGRESSDWFAFFEGYGMGGDFMKILSDADYERPTDKVKKHVFDLWLKYLFAEKLYAEYGGDNWYRDEYFSPIAQ